LDNIFKLYGGTTQIFKNYYLVHLSMVGLKDIEDSTVRVLVKESRNLDRGRSALAFHPSHHTGPRLLVNAIQPGSYIRPHRHHTYSGETWMIYQGSVGLVTFDDQGEVNEKAILGIDRPVVEIPDKTWHTALALEEDSVVYELSMGPYREGDYKEFMPGTPEEGTREVFEFYKKLRSLF
jgi:cupin fold WbuC family metalloprotein